MAVPKRKVSKARTHKRRANKSLTSPQRSTCPRCDASVLPHTICANCGNYRGKSYPIIKDEFED